MFDATDRDRRHQVWQALQASPEPLGIAALARRLAVHPNTIRFHLAALQQAGRVEQVAGERSGPGRPAQRFRAVTGMDPAGVRHYLLLAQLLAEGLAAAPDATARAIEAGRAWGRLAAADGSDVTATGHTDPAAPTAPMDRLVSLLADLGFAPENPAAGADVVRLRHCPFLELARRQAAIVCPIHLGLMQGALAGWDAEVTVEQLQPFAEPDLCTAHLAAA